MLLYCREDTPAAMRRAAAERAAAVAAGSVGETKQDASDMGSVPLPGTRTRSLSDTAARPSLLQAESR